MGIKMESGQSPGLLGQVESKDPGDDVQRRFRYQAAYTAFPALDLLNPDSEFEEIFCEHHEDTLIRKKDGKFVGMQVKTRELGRDPFKANDGQIIHAIKRFVEQSIQYPGDYSYFVIATNYSFWNEKRSSQNLHYLIELAKGASGTPQSEWPTPISKYITRLIREMDPNLRELCAPNLFLNVLSNIRLEHKPPKFDDIESRLVSQIPLFYDARSACYDDLLRAAKMLIDKMFEAASLSHISPRQAYFSLLSDPQRSEIDAIIEGKRITREIVHHILKEMLSTEALLRTTAPISISDLPIGMRMIELKMAKGKISFSNIQNAKDHKYSIEILLDTWFYKYGQNKANEQYQQLIVIIGNICQEAYDRSYKDKLAFGQEMLRLVRERIYDRHTNDPDSFFGCKYEHLLGVAGLLTEQCKVWWSNQFELPREL